MKRVLVKSVFDAFDYVMDHYYPAGLEDLASRSDTYAVISIQDTHTKGFYPCKKKGGYAADSLLCGPVPFPGCGGFCGEDAGRR